MARLTPESLDEILDLQLALAWAGETPGGEHPRLGWWRTDLVDGDGGGDLWKRLLPRTHRWAGLNAARRAARTTDARLRGNSKNADQMVTLFHFGFELDEALDERLAHHTRDARTPAEVLPALKTILAPFDRSALLAAVSERGLDGAFKIGPAGRQLKHAGAEAPHVSARRLACALLADPAAKDYPVAFFLDEAGRGEQ